MDSYDTFRKKHKTLCKTYYKKLKEYQKLMFDLPAGPMAYFVTFLQYLRDAYLLIDDKIATAEDYNNKVVETLSDALITYDWYTYSNDNYMKAVYDLQRLAEGEDRTKLEAEEKKWASETMKYFNTFWDMVKKYYLMWLRGNKVCS